ncbi:cation:proton antiporter [Candidatus Woesearchaeota archaeon]|nr:cation:proton antiporter [Candidatus Woesearchaeota archaeon]
MSLISGLFIVGITIILGLVSQYSFKKTKIPDALILIIFGAVLTFFGLTSSIDKENPILNFLITFSLIYVVFYGALPIKIRAIFSTMKYAFLSSLLNFIFITAALGAIAYFVGFSWAFALSLGALFCVIDGTIVNSLLDILKVSEKAEAQIQIEGAVVDTLVIVGVMTIINFANMTTNQIISSLSSYLFLSFGVGLAAAIIWAFTLKYVGDYSSAPIATMAILVLLYAFAEYIKANGVITVFSFSIIMGNVALWSRLMYKEQKGQTAMLDISTKSFFRDISFLIRTFLFVYLGILVDFTQWVYLLIGLGFFLIAYTIRSFIYRIVSNEELTKKQLYLIEAMAAKGLTPIVLLAVVQADVRFANIVIGGIFFSVLATSILIPLIENGKFTSPSELILRKIHKRYDK